MEGRLHGLFGVLGAGFLVDADDLGGARGVDGADLALGFEAPATDDQVEFPAELAGDQVQCSLHVAGVFRSLEIDEGFILEAALGQARLNLGGKRCGGHDAY